jgi:hypothetical protein
MDEIKNKLVQASKVYADQTVVRAAINAIPFIGGSLDILLSSTGQNFVIKRIETLISELNVQLQQLDNSKINHEFLETEVGFDLVIKAFNSASRTRQNEKLKLYAKILKGALTEGKEYQEDDPELYLQIIEELSVKELRVAKCLFELKEVKKIHPEQDNPDNNQDGMTNDAWWLSKQFPEFDKDELVSIFVRLERTGLIKELVGSYIGYGGGQYLINPLFKKFITFIGEIDLHENKQPLNKL